MRSFDERVATWKKFSRFLPDTSSPKQPLQSINAFWRVPLQCWLLKKNPGKQTTQIHVLTSLRSQGWELSNKVYTSQKKASPKYPKAEFQLWFPVLICFLALIQQLAWKWAVYRAIYSAQCAIGTKGTLQLAKISRVLDTSPLSKISDQEP